MSYGLANGIDAASAFTAISDDEYVALTCSLTGIIRMLRVEEQLDLVLENYLDFENGLLSLATRHMISGTLDYDNHQLDRNLIVNRRLSNVLNACRGYLDHTPHHLNGLNDLSGKKIASLSKSFKVFTNIEYEKCLGYRVMEALRNYTQHQGFPTTVLYEHRTVDEIGHGGEKVSGTNCPLRNQLPASGGRGDGGWSRARTGARCRLGSGGQVLQSCIGAMLGRCTKAGRLAQDSDAPSALVPRRVRPR
jgi:hypothetical protein